jgi:hypothetical protein
MARTASKAGGRLDFPRASLYATLLKSLQANCCRDQGSNSGSDRVEFMGDNVALGWVCVVL